MTISPLKLQELSEHINPNTVKLKDPGTLSKSIGTLLSDTQSKVDWFMNSKSQETAKQIISNLDKIKWLLDGVDEKVVLQVMKELQKDNWKLWRSYSWERTDTSDISWNEDNWTSKFRVQWISADDIITIARNRQKLYQEKMTITIILTMAWIYGLTNEILRSIHTSKK